MGTFDERRVAREHDPGGAIRRRRAFGMQADGNLAHELAARAGEGGEVRRAVVGVAQGEDELAEQGRIAAQDARDVRAPQGLAAQGVVALELVSGAEVELVLEEERRRDGPIRREGAQRPRPAGSEREEVDAALARAQGHAPAEGGGRHVGTRREGGAREHLSGRAIEHDEGPPRSGVAQGEHDLALPDDWLALEGSARGVAPGDLRLVQESRPRRGAGAGRRSAGVAPGTQRSARAVEIERLPRSIRRERGGEREGESEECREHRSSRVRRVQVERAPVSCRPHGSPT
jgi:hypothetical protein